MEELADFFYIDSDDETEEKLAELRALERARRRKGGIFEIEFEAPCELPGCQCRRIFFRVLVHALGYLDAFSLCSLERVCKHWARLIRDYERNTWRALTLRRFPHLQLKLSSLEARQVLWRDVYFRTELASAKSSAQNKKKTKKKKKKKKDNEMDMVTGIGMGSSRRTISAREAAVSSLTSALNTKDMDQAIKIVVTYPEIMYQTCGRQDKSYVEHVIGHPDHVPVLASYLSGPNRAAGMGPAFRRAITVLTRQGGTPVRSHYYYRHTRAHVNVISQALLNQAFEFLDLVYQHCDIPKDVTVDALVAVIQRACDMGMGRNPCTKLEPHVAYMWPKANPTYEDKQQLVTECIRRYSPGGLGLILGRCTAEDLKSLHSHTIQGLELPAMALQSSTHTKPMLQALVKFGWPIVPGGDKHGNNLLHLACRSPSWADSEPSLVEWIADSFPFMMNEKNSSGNYPVDALFGPISGEELNFYPGIRDTDRGSSAPARRFRALIDRGQTYFYTPERAARRIRDWGLVKLMLEAGFDPHMKLGSVEQPVSMQACGYRKTYEATGWTLLHRLCLHGMAQFAPDTLSVLWEHKVDVDAKDDMGRTPLFLLFDEGVNGPGYIACALLAAGANPLPRNALGQMPGQSKRTQLTGRRLALWNTIQEADSDGFYNWIRNWACHGSHESAKLATAGVLPFTHHSCTTRPIRADSCFRTDTVRTRLGTEIRVCSRQKMASTRQAPPRTADHSKSGGPPSDNIDDTKTMASTSDVAAFSPTSAPSRPSSSSNRDNNKCFYNNNNNTVGQRLWSSAMCLVAYLEDNPGIVKGMNVAELGCGTGLCGVAAAMLGAKRVIMSDVDGDVLSLAYHNAKLNGVENRVTTRLTDVRSAHSFFRGDVMDEPLSVVLVSDLTYSHLLIQNLFSALYDLFEEAVWTSTSPVVLLAHEPRPWLFALGDEEVEETREEYLLRVGPSMGMIIEEVSSSSLSASPPERRVVLYKVTPGVGNFQIKTAPTPPPAPAMPSSSAAPSSASSK